MSKLKFHLERVPVFIFTIPLFIVLHLEAEYRHLIKYEFVIPEIIQLVVAPLLITAGCYFLFKRWPKRLVFSFILCLLFFFFADVKDYFFKISPNLFVGRYSFLLPAVLVVSVIAFILIKKSNSEFRRLIFYINVTFLLFVAVDSARILLNQKVNPRSIYFDNQSIAENYMPCDTCEKPDIYYLVFDYYTSSASLAENFNHDNSDIDSFLTGKGFKIITNSRSNYNFTAHSISSTLNMNYLKRITPFKKIYLKDYLPIIGCVFDNDVVSVLKKEGYAINNFSIFDLNKVPAQLPTFNFWEYQLLYSRHNIFKKINSEIGWLIGEKIKPIMRFDPPENKFADDKATYDSLAFSKFVETIPTGTGPKFTYLHSELAHAPFVLDSSGRKHEMREWPVDLEQDKKDYVSQLTYTNKILRKCINEIFSKSKRPFVVILQGDHGFRFFDKSYKDKEFANLNAFFFPDRNYSLLNDSLTNVNTFPIIFNKYFKQKFSMLKDSVVYIDY